MNNKLRILLDYQSKLLMNLDLSLAEIKIRTDFMNKIYEIINKAKVK